MARAAAVPLTGFLDLRHCSASERSSSSCRSLTVATPPEPCSSRGGFFCELVRAIDPSISLVLLCQIVGQPSCRPVNDHSIPAKICFIGVRCCLFELQGFLGKLPESQFASSRGLDFGYHEA